MLSTDIVTQIVARLAVTYHMWKNLLFLLCDVLIDINDNLHILTHFRWIVEGRNSKYEVKINHIIIIMFSILLC